MHHLPESESDPHFLAQLWPQLGAHHPSPHHPHLKRRAAEAQQAQWQGQGQG